MSQLHGQQVSQKKMRGQGMAPHLKTNSKFILKMYDKNLLQSNDDSENYEIPISWGFWMDK